MNIENLKNMPVVGEAPASSIAQLAETVAARNLAIRNAVSAIKTEKQQKIGANKDAKLGLEQARYDAWLAAHNDAMTQDTSDLGEKYTAAQANLANIVSNTEGISDSIKEFADDVAANKAAINSGISVRSSKLNDNREKFRTDMGVASDLVLS